MFWRRVSVRHNWLESHRDMRRCNIKADQLQQIQRRQIHTKRFSDKTKVNFKSHSSSRHNVNWWTTIRNEKSKNHKCINENETENVTRMLRGKLLFTKWNGICELVEKFESYFGGISPWRNLSKHCGVAGAQSEGRDYEFIRMKWHFRVHSFVFHLVFSSSSSLFLRMNRGNTWFPPQFIIVTAHWPEGSLAGRGGEEQLIAENQRINRNSTTVHVQNNNNN